MSSGRHVNRAVLRVCFAAAACSMVATYSHSAPYELIYEGFFTSAEAFNPASSPAPIYFAGTNPFKIKARFDDSSPNLAPSPPLPPLNPFGGFRAYAPSAMTLEAAGQVFSVIGADNQGLSVRSSTRTASSQASMGWASSSMRSRRAPASLATSVRRHRISLWTHWYRPSSRASVASGTVPAPAVRARRPTAPHLVTPLVLRDASNVAWNLTLANYEMDPPDQPVNIAQITAVPEPASSLLILAGLGVVGLRARRA